MNSFLFIIILLSRHSYDLINCLLPPPGVRVTAARITAHRVLGRARRRHHGADYCPGKSDTALYYVLLLSVLYVTLLKLSLVYFTLFCFILFYFTLLYFTLFHLFNLILLYFTLHKSTFVLFLMLNSTLRLSTSHHSTHLSLALFSLLKLFLSTL